jgi:ribosome production factor 1
MFKSAEKTALQEIGPRFTLKLRYIKKGIPAVHQLGAAPPPLEFDNEDADEEVIPADSERPDKVTEKHDASAASTAPQKYAAPAKDEEYIWQWKVR